MQEEVEGAASIEAELPCCCCVPATNKERSRGSSGAFPCCWQPGEIKKPRSQQLREGGGGGRPVTAACSILHMALWAVDNIKAFAEAQIGHFCPGTSSEHSSCTQGGSGWQGVTSSCPTVTLWGALSSSSGTGNVTHTAKPVLADPRKATATCCGFACPHRGARDSSRAGVTVSMALGTGTHTLPGTAAASP